MTIIRQKISAVALRKERYFSYISANKCRFATLSEDEFLTELRKRIPKKGKTTDPLGVAGQEEVKQLYNDYALPMQTRNREILQLEHQVSDLVNHAYGLTPEDIDLMWRTAPPRMPIQRTTQPISDAIA